MLRARLEEVSATARDVAGLAAAVGRDFTLDLLVEASELDADAVVRALDELWRRRIVRETASGYDFSHDLLREAAYALASPPTRWLLHRRVAQALELLHADDLDAVSARLARALRPRRARGPGGVDYRRAADVAASRFAHDEAIRLLREALELVRAMPAGRHRDEAGARPPESLAAPLNARHGYASPLVRETLERVGGARRPARAARRRAVRARRAVDRAASSRATSARPTAIATRALAMADGRPLPSPRPPTSRRRVGVRPRAAPVGAAPLRGRHRRGGHGVAERRHPPRRARRGPGPPTRTGCSATTTRPATTAAEAVARARRVEHPYSLAVALAYDAVTHQFRDDRPSWTARSDELSELCERYGFAYYREWGLVLAGWAATVRTAPSTARRGVDGLRATGAFARMPYWLSLFADIAQRRGRPDEARAMLDAAVADARARDDVWWLPEVLRMRAALDDDPARRRTPAGRGRTGPRARQHRAAAPVPRRPPGRRSGRAHGRSEAPRPHG